MISTSPWFARTLRTCSILALGAVLTTSASCGDEGATCGPGTVLKDGQCLPSGGGFNVIVDDFKLGQFQMSNVDVPENLLIGTPETRSFTIKNAGTDARSVVSIRFGIVPVQSRIEELRDALDTVDKDTPIDATFIGQVFLENLAPGESRKVDYTLNVPNTLSDGLYGFFFAVDEVPLVKGEDGNYALDLSKGDIAKQDGNVRLGYAALLHAPATVIVGKPDHPNLRILSAKLDNASFELDRSEKGDSAMFTVSGRMSSQGLNLTSEANASFALRLPGHVIDVPGQDLGPSAFASNEDYLAAPATTTYRYDANRSFPLAVRRTEGLAPSVSYQQRCFTREVADEVTGDVSTFDDCAVIFNEEGLDDVYQLHLSTDAIRLLESTESNKAVNPGLDANGEIHGTLVMTVATAQPEYQDNHADNVKEMPVVFMAPEPAVAATPADTDNGGVAEVANAYGQSGPYPYVTQQNRQGQSWGNEWFGASYQFDTNASYDKHHDVAISHYKKAEASVRATFLKQGITLLGGGATVDWGVDKAVAQFKAEARITVLGFNLVNFQFNPSICQTSGGLTACPLFEIQLDEATKQDPSDKGEPRKLKYFKGTEYQSYFSAGPVPCVIKAETGATLGMGLYGFFIIDGRSNVLNKYGVQFAAGPTAELSSTIFGGATLGVARAGVEGSLKLASISFLPYIMPLAGVSYDTGRNCFKAAEASLEFAGPITVAGPSGTMSLAAYAGVKVCLFGRCVKSEKKVFSFTIASFSTYSQTWNLWNLKTAWKKRPGDAGMCPDAIQPSAVEVWRSPTSCANGYCANSSSNVAGLGSHIPSRVIDAYKKTYTRVGGISSCVDVRVQGRTREELDRVVLYDASGAPQNRGVMFRRVGTFKFPNGSMWGWSGAIDITQRVCSPSVTAALESGANAGGQPGVTVTFTPVD
ncbi:MAG: hypothetical protein JNJ59_10600 [Deltaproteobacteria bacterium]|nr:hypothetical protein [Deltaproteobacteria bacterium]